MLSEKIRQQTSPSFSDILVIENDSQQLDSLVGILSNYCQSLYVYETLQDSFLHLRQKHSPAVIVTNDVLPDGNPNNLIKSYRNQSCIIVMSKLCKPEDAFMFGRLGARSLLHKPIDQQKVDLALKNIYQFDPPRKYQVTTFGGLSICKFKDEIEHSRKPPYKVLELIACLAALGGLNVPVATICDYLWPDLEGDRAKKNFTLCLRRARDLFDKNDVDVIVRKANRISFNSTKVMLDIWQFNKTPQDDVATAAGELSENHFLKPWLPEYDQYWAIEPRNKYTRITKNISHQEI